jgi:hypothetical protein
MATYKTQILSACLTTVLFSGTTLAIAAMGKREPMRLPQNFSNQIEPGAPWHSYSNAGFEAIAVGNYKHAEALFNEGLKQKGYDAKGQAVLLTGLGEALLWQDNVSKAASALNKAYSIGQRQFGEESADIAETLEALSWLYQAQGKVDKAEDASEQAVAIRKKILPGSYKLAESLEHRGQLAEDKGLYEDAQSLYKEALDIRLATTGPESIATANTLEKLATVLQKRGQLDNAQTVFNHVLKIKQAPQDPLRQYATMRTDSRVIFRFLPGAPNCTSNFVDNNMAEQITGNNITVQARLVKAPGKSTTLAEITIYNDSNRKIHVLPQAPTLIVLSPKVRLARVVDSEKLAEKIEKKGESKAKWIRFWGENATTSITSTIYGNGFPPYGYMNPNFGYNGLVYGNRNNGLVYGNHNNGFVYGNRNNGLVYGNRNNGFNNGNRYYNNNQYYNRNPYYNPYATGYGYNNYPETVVTNVPDYQARARAIAKANQATSTAQNQARALRQKQLADSILNPRASISGALMYDEKQIDEGILRVPVGNAIFEFIFDKNASAGAAS